MRAFLNTVSRLAVLALEHVLIFSVGRRRGFQINSPRREAHARRIPDRD